MSGNEYTQLQDNEYHEEQEEFTEGTENTAYEESIVIDGEIHYLNDEWKEWSQKQHHHNPKYTVMEWFEWGVKHYFLGDEAEDDDEEEDQTSNEQPDYYAEYDYENQDGKQQIKMMAKFLTKKNTWRKILNICSQHVAMVNLKN